MSNTTDPDLCSLITNVYKPLKNFDFQKIVQPFMFAWFEEFPWACYLCLEDRTCCLPCVLFDYKYVGKFLQKTISIMENSKNIQKTSKCSNRNTQKEANIVS